MWEKGWSDRMGIRLAAIAPGHGAGIDLEDLSGGDQHIDGFLRQGQIFRVRKGMHGFLFIVSIP